jgi:hypothetical protein
VTRRTTTDQVAARALVNSCRRMDRAIGSGDVPRAELARADAVEHMANLLDELGLPHLSTQLHEAAQTEFGQEIDE